MAGRRAPPDRAALAKACAALPVFPLPGLVALPGTPTPLHVFEPRYRALVADVLAGGRLLALPTLVSEEGAREARAEVRPIAGVVFLASHHLLPDGRSDVIVRGLARVRLVAEVETSKPYRAFRAELLEDRLPAGGAAALAPRMETVVQLVLELTQALPVESGAAQLAEAAAHLRDPSALADLVAAAVVSETDARYRVLETLDVARRLELVEEEVASVLLVLSQGRGPRA